MPGRQDQVPLQIGHRHRGPFPFFGPQHEPWCDGLDVSHPRHAADRHLEDNLDVAQASFRRGRQTDQQPIVLALWRSGLAIDGHRPDAAPSGKVTSRNEALLRSRNRAAVWLLPNVETSVTSSLRWTSVSGSA